MKSQREFPRLVISPKGTRWVEQGHPWIYEAEVVSGGEDAENGVLVDAVSEKGKYLGTGFLSRKSKIRVRLISRNANDRFDAAFWKRRIKYAWDYRKVVMGSDTGCCRVIFGEADGFPGLTVDRFSELLVVQTLSVGMERIKDTLFPLLAEVLREDGQDIRGIFERNDVAMRELEGLEQYKGWYPLPGETHPESPVTEICETAYSTRSMLKTGRKPASSSTRNTTASLWRGSQRGAAYSTALRTPGRSRSTPRSAARSTSRRWTSPPRQ